MDWKEVGSKVATLQARLIKEGLAQSDARHQACAQIGQEYAMSGADLASGYGSWAGNRSIHPVSKSKSRRHRRGDGGLGTGPKELYWTWLEKHDDVAPDGQLAHFHGNCVPNAFSFARRKLKDEGWEFERLNGMWHVTKRPEPEPEPEPQPAAPESIIVSEVAALKEMMEELLAKLT